MYNRIEYAQYEDYLQHSLFSKDTNLKQKAQNFAKSVKDTGLRNTLSSYGRNIDSRAKSDIKSGAKYMKEEFIPKYKEKVKTASGNIRYIYEDTIRRAKNAKANFRTGLNTGYEGPTKAHKLGAAVKKVKDRVSGAASRFAKGYKQGGETGTSRAYNLGSALGSVLNRKGQSAYENAKIADDKMFNLADIENKKKRMKSINSAPSGQTWYV